MNIVLDTDAPRDHEYTREVAEAAAEAVRVLNHATLSAGSGALRYPSDVDAVLRSLSSMAARLPQLLGQLSRWLAEENAVARVQMDRGTRYEGRPDEAVSAVWLALDSAAALAMQLGEKLAAAASVTVGMAAAGEEDEDA